MLGSDVCLSMLYICILILASLPDVWFKFYNRNEDTGAEIEHRPFRAF